MTALLEVEGVAKRFGGVNAVDDCSLQVAEGTVTALIGPNGSGKTTLFNVVTGYLPADAGVVRFAGRRFDRPDPARLYRSGLTRTFQQARVFPMLTLIENLVAAIHQSWRSLLRARVSGSDMERAREVLDQFGIAHLAQRRAGELSFGQRKLLEFRTVDLPAPLGPITQVIAPSLSSRSTPRSTSPWPYPATRPLIASTAVTPPGRRRGRADRCGPRRDVPRRSWRRGRARSPDRRGA